jgi:hypothetical protein
LVIEIVINSMSVPIIKAGNLRGVLDQGFLESGSGRWCQLRSRTDTRKMNDSLTFSDILKEITCMSIEESVV